MRRVRTRLPNSPLSYSGAILCIRWCVRLRLFLRRGRDYVLEPNSRTTLYVQDQAPALASTAVSIRLASTNGVSFSPDGRLVASSSTDGSMRWSSRLRRVRRPAMHRARLIRIRC